MFLKKNFSGGILTMKIGTSTKITAGAISLLAIFTVGFIAFRTSTQPPKAESRNVLEQAGQTKVSREQQSDKLLSPNHSQIRTSQIEEVSEHDQTNAAKSYDERYDMLIEICQQMEPILGRISQINDEYMRRYDEIVHFAKVKNRVGNLTENEISIIRELKPLGKEYEMLSAEYDTLPDKVNDVIPGAVKTKSVDMSTTLPFVEDVLPEVAELESIDLPSTITVTYIDYKFIKSMLGPMPEELDACLLQFLAAAWGRNF